MSESIMTTDKLGNKFWKNSLDQFHRLDGPAVEWVGGSKEWWQNGLRHRIDGPAVEHSDGITKLWYQNGIHHRTDGPAVEWVGGKISWYIKGNFLNDGLEGFWEFWERLNNDERQNVNLHMWLRKLTNS